MLNRPATGGGLWRRMPPAVFPPLLGFVGLGLLWRHAPDALAPLRPMGEVLLGAGIGLLAVTAAAYGAKLLARPAVLGEELRVLPGRVGLAALAMTLMIAAAALAPYGPFALPLLAAGLGLHGLIAAASLWRLLAGPAEARSLSPADHLVFVGGIAGTVATIPLGLAGLTALLLWTGIAFSGVVYAACARQMLRRATPAPLRPLLAIHLSPVSLAGSAALVLGHGGLGLALALLALAFAGMLLIRLPWLCEAGFSAFWGSFTFPVVAFAALMLLAGETGGIIFRGAGLAAFLLASATIPVIVARVLRLWLRGTLAVTTNAAAA